MVTLTPTGPVPADRGAAFLIRAGQVLASSVDYERTLENLVTLAVPDLADGASVHVREPDDRVRTVALRSVDAAVPAIAKAWRERKPPSLEDAHGVGRVIREGRPEYVLDLAPEMVRKLAPPGTEDLAERLGVRSFIVVPIPGEERPAGAITLTMTSSGRRFTEADVALAQDLALRAGGAIESARIHARLATLQSLAAKLAPAATLDEVARVLVDEAAAAVGATTAVLSLLDEDAEHLEIRRAHGVAEAVVTPFARIPMDADLPVPQAVRAGRDLFVGDRAELLSGWSGLREEQLEGHAWAILPLRDADRAHGALWFGFPSARRFSAHERAFLRTLADHGGQSLARVRLAHAALVRQQLLESQNEAALDGIFFQDAQARPAFHNRRLLEIFGVDPETPTLPRLEDRLARSMSTIADPEAFVALAMRMEQEPEASLRFDLLLRDGRILDAYTTPVKGPDGTRLGRAWYYRDVTEARRLQRELMEARQGLAQREKLAALGSLVSGVAHEVRTPLAYVANHAHVLDALAQRSGAAEAPRMRESAAAILEGVERIDRLVQDLRRFTRTRAPAPAECAADEATTAAARLFEATHPGRVRLDVAASVGGRVPVERVELQQVLLNLLENAADASPSGAVVRVRARAEGPNAVFEVEDDGPGIPPDLQARMWEPFFTTKPDGTGLGLSIVRRIAETHGGSVSCESAAGRGARFRVVLPLQGRAGGPPAPRQA